MPDSTSLIASLTTTSAAIRNPSAHLFDDGRMRHGFERRKLLRIAKDNLAKCRSIECPGRIEDSRSKTINDSIQEWRRRGDQFSVDHVCVDHLRAQLSQECRDLRLPRGYGAGESDDQRTTSPRGVHVVATRFASVSVALTSSHSA